MISRRNFLAGAAAAPGARTASKSNIVSLRTHEWFEDRLEQFEFPAGWRISVCHMKGWQAPVLDAGQIRMAVENPVGTAPLREIAAGKKTAAIAFDDLTRPTPTYEIVPHVVRELNAAGIRDENILFIAAHGCHYQMNGMEVAKKIGKDAVRRHPWIDHNVWENLDEVGVTKAKNQVLVNTYYHKADVRITLSGVLAHATAGYGGGPKLVLPGVCGIKTIRYMHETIRRKRMPATDKSGIPIFYMWENEQRQDMIEAARLAGVNFSVQCVYNQERRPMKVVAGDIVKAHHQTARFAVNQLYTDYAKDANVVIVNAYPKGSQLNGLFGWGSRGLKKGGSVVVINQNPMGQFAWHYLDEPRLAGGKSYFQHRDERRPQFPEAAQVLLYSAYLQKRELDNHYFPPEAVGCYRWSDVLDRLKRTHKSSDVHVAVYPYAGLQHGPAVLDLPDGV